MAASSPVRARSEWGLGVRPSIGAVRVARPEYLVLVVVFEELEDGRPDLLFGAPARDD
jgi:hypothetical protein